MGKLLRTAEALAKGKLSGKELDDALANERIVRQAKTLCYGKPKAVAKKKGGGK